MSIGGSTTDRIARSQPERDVLKVMHQVLSGTIQQSEAARLLRLNVRHVRRNQRRLEVEGDQAVVHRAEWNASSRQPRTAGSRNCVWPRSQAGSKPTLCSIADWRRSSTAALRRPQRGRSMRTVAWVRVTTWPRF